MAAYLRRVTIYVRLEQHMPAALHDAAEARKQMLAALRTAAKRYLSIYGSFSRAYRGYKAAYVEGGTDVFIPTLGRLCNGLEATEKTYKVGADMTVCLDALKCFTEFMDCGKKTGPDASFADIYQDPKHFEWKRLWLDAMYAMCCYILACTSEHSGATVLLANYEWDKMLRKVRDEQEKVNSVLATKKPVRRIATTLLNKVQKWRVSKSELPDAHVLERMRGLLDELD